MVLCLFFAVELKNNDVDVFCIIWGSDVIKNCLAQNQRTEPQTATQKLQATAPFHLCLFVCLFVCTTLAFCVCECMYVDVFLVCLLQIQAKSVVSRTPVLGLQHLQQTCFVFVMFTFIYSCVCVACEWEQLKTHLISENLTKISHPICKCNCWHRFSLLCASYSVATQYIVDVL